MMTGKAFIRFNMLIQALESDEEFLSLCQEQQRWEAAFQEEAEGLTDAQRSAITNLLGIHSELERRILELACFLP